MLNILNKMEWVVGKTVTYQGYTKTDGFGVMEFLLKTKFEMTRVLDKFWI